MAPPTSRTEHLLENLTAEERQAIAEANRAFLSRYVPGILAGFAIGYRMSRIPVVAANRTLKLSTVFVCGLTGEWLGRRLGRASAGTIFARLPPDSQLREAFFRKRAVRPQGEGMQEDAEAQGLGQDRETWGRSGEQGAARPERSAGRGSSADLVVREPMPQEPDVEEDGFLPTTTDTPANATSPPKFISWAELRRSSATLIPPTLSPEANPTRAPPARQPTTSASGEWEQGDQTPAVEGPKPTPRRNKYGDIME